jgi:hypothetical protein
VQSLWIHNIAIMTGLVTSTTTPPPLKLIAGGSSTSTTRQPITSSQTTCWIPAAVYIPSAVKMSLPCGAGIMPVALANPQPGRG